MRLVGFVDARLFPTGFFGLCMAWELELLYGFGDWSFYGFGDWSFYGLPDVWSFYGFSDRRSFQSWLLWICLVTGASVDLMVGSFRGFNGVLDFFLPFFFVHALER